MPGQIYREESIAAPTNCKVDWEGWEASFIRIQSSKPKKKVPPFDYDTKLSEDYNSKKKAKVTGEHTADVYMCIGGAKIPEREMEYSCEAEVLRHFSWSDFYGYAGSWSLICKEASYFTQEVERRINWKRLELSLPQHVFQKLRGDVHRSIVKVVLTIFDLEDFANAYVSQERRDNYVQLYERFKFSYEGDSIWGLLEAEDKAQKHALQTIAEDIDKNQFAELVEADIYSLLYALIRKSLEEDKVDSVILFRNEVSSVISSRHKDSDKYDWPLTPKEMEEIEVVPLKGRYKAQLTLELVRQKHYYVLDSLVVEACMGCISKKLLEVAKEKVDGNTMRAATILADKLVYPLQDGIYDIAIMKSTMLRLSWTHATFPLYRRAFGRFSKDVYDVIYVAEYQRRKLGHRFVGVDVESPEMPAYRIYKLAGDYASQFGSESVELEHLVLAVYCVKRGEEGRSWSLEDLQSLQKMNDPYVVDGWKDPDLVIRGKETFSGFVDLVKGLMEESIELPPLRMVLN